MARTLAHSAARTAAAWSPRGLLEQLFAKAFDGSWAMPPTPPISRTTRSCDRICRRARAPTGMPAP